MRDSVMFPFHSILAANLAAGVANFNATPAALSNRALIEADCWAHFRIPRLAFRLHPASTSASNSAQVAGFIGGVQDTPPTTITQVGELLPSCCMAADATVPSEWIRVPRTDLAGPLPWYKTIAGTADATEESPGNLIVAGNATDAYFLELRGVFEFKTSVSAGNTPLEVALRKQLREERTLAMIANERKSILKVLGTPTSPAK